MWGQAGVERLKQKLDEANAHNKKDMEEALNSMHWQLRTYVLLSVCTPELCAPVQHLHSR